MVARAPLRYTPTMTADELLASLAEGTPPRRASRELLALWLDAKGDFDGSHEIAQALTNPGGALIHAYLHRKEGDLGNARYWYRQAGVDLPSTSLEAEWRSLVEHFSS